MKIDLNHEPRCPARFEGPDPCDCGAVRRKTIAQKLDAGADGCATTLGKTLGALTGWSFCLWVWRHEIARGAAWIAAHVRIVP